ncbi:MAG: hypothetical protein AAFP97_03935 [Pseudomonadota bacterium]
MDELIEKTMSLIFDDLPTAGDFFGQDHETPALFLEEDEIPLFI